MAGGGHPRPHRSAKQMTGAAMEATATKDIAPLAGEAKVRQLIAVREQYKGETRKTHAQRVLSALRLGPLSTFAARRHLDVPHPGGRDHELRNAGHEITPFRVPEPRDIGRPHTIALYVLHKEAQP